MLDTIELGGHVNGFNGNFETLEPIVAMLFNSKDVNLFYRKCASTKGLRKKKRWWYQKIGISFIFNTTSIAGLYTRKPKIE